MQLFWGGISLSPHGESGLKWNWGHLCGSAAGLSPHGESGLKFQSGIRDFVAKQVFLRMEKVDWNSTWMIFWSWGRESFSAWRKWIEIFLFIFTFPRFEVFLRMEKVDWNDGYGRETVDIMSFSAWRKWIEIKLCQVYELNYTVFLRMEKVDWNR